jgi:hypothetical protein
MRAAAVLALALLAACSATPSTGPVPLAMAPDQATPFAATDVEIDGRGFGPAVRTDFGDASGSAVSAAFEARLAPVAGGPDVPLEAVALTPKRTLAARVPPGLPTGAYDLVVVAPDGREGRLPAAFRVVSASENVASFRFAPPGLQAAGVPFRVVVTAVDEAGLTVGGYAGTAALEDETGTVTPAVLGPFVLGRATAIVTIPALAASTRLTARDALGHAGTSDPFAVGAGPPVAVAFASVPPGSAGACLGPVEVEARDALGHPSAPSAAVPVRLDAAPPGAVTFFSDAGCASAVTSVGLAAGATRLSFHVRAAAAGTVAVRVLPETLPSAEQEVDFAP